MANKDQKSASFPVTTPPAYGPGDGGDEGADPEEKGYMAFANVNKSVAGSSSIVLGTTNVSIVVSHPFKLIS